MARRPKTLRPIRPNAGVEAKYQRALDNLLSEMDKSLRYWITAEYRKALPRITQDAAAGMAMDASVASMLQTLMNRLTKRWRKKFDDTAKELADRTVFDVERNSTAAMQKALKGAGVTVQFKPTPAVKQAMQLAVNENVMLIKSIAEQHLNDVGQMAMRSAMRGGDLKELTDGLTERFGITRRRAANIARDQNSKITTAINRQRQMDMGLFEAEWMHSGGGKEPRPKHVAAGRTRLRFDIREGVDVDGDGRKILPGQDINCRCTWRMILPGFND